MCSFNTKINKMEEIKKLVEKTDRCDEKLHLSGVIKSVCIWKFKNECSFYKDEKCSLEKTHCDFKMQTVL